ncbi:hypothetical protein PUN28_010133 [Cardiocondyla obscurior]|uniref:Odorant receptor n=1 Tax=Cardiocondyla obscurior TaxID=286306 RepID=A0AAW2FQL9_9HYME
MKLIIKSPVKTSKQNTNYNYAVQVTRLILRLIGVWPIPSNASIVERIMTRTQNVICYLLTAFLIVPGLLRIFLKEHEFKSRIRLTAPIINCGMACLKYILLMYHAREVQFCLDQVSQDWNDAVNENDRRIMLSNAKSGRKFAIYSALFMYIGGLSYRILIPLSKGRILTPMNTTVRVLACPSYFVFFDGGVSPAYEIIFTLQIFAGVITYSVRCGIAGLAALFVMHVCGQLSIVVDKVHSLDYVPKSNNRAVMILLADIVERQNKIKKFLKKVETTLQYVWLAEVTDSAILVCLSLYYIIMGLENNQFSDVFTMTVMLASFAFALFTNCYVGQRLTDQSIKVRLMIAASKWYRFQYKTSRTFVLLMAVSNIPTKISAGKIVEMSLPTFSNIIKSSVAYFNILRNFT